MQLPTYDVHQHFAGFDERVEQAWDHLRGVPALDRLFYAASEVGDFGLLWMAIAAGQAAFGPPDKLPAALRMAAALGIESLIVNVGIKSLFRRDRPDWHQDRPHALRRPKTSSFPSGHATSAITALLLLTERGTPWWPVYTAAAGLVAGSRVHVKIHHASDVIGGLLVGAVLGTAFKRLLPIG